MNSLTKDEITREEAIILDVIQSARNLEEYLWGQHNPGWGLEEWRRMFRKREGKIEEINSTNPHWKIELRKRLMQNAALSVAMMRLLDEGKIDGFDGVHPDGVPSNLPEYAGNNDIRVAVKVAFVGLMFGITVIICWFIVWSIL